MKIEILNTGSELLSGRWLNTHSQWMAQELFKLGLRVRRVTSVPDGEEVIREALEGCVQRAEVVFVTGGLGPTSDDVTREAAAAVTGLELREDAGLLDGLRAYFAGRDRPMAPENRKQAQILAGCEILANTHGTAPGLFVPAIRNRGGACALFLLPGPPRELYPMWREQIVPRLRALGGGEQGMEMLELSLAEVGESDVQHEIDADLGRISGLEFGYCAHIGRVDVRLLGRQEVLVVARERVLRSFASQCFSESGETLEEVVVKRMAARGLTLATAESCTGGLIADRLTDVPGASAVLTHGWVSYANAAKVGELGVSAEDLALHGAVSEVVARQMAEGALREAGTDRALAVTGIAGPGGGSEAKPVGTVFLALACKGGETRVRKSFYPRDRRTFKRAVSQEALDWVRQSIHDGV